MKHALLVAAVALSVALSIPTASWAADTETSPAKAHASADYQAGKAAVETRQWGAAADHFRRVTAQDPTNADAWNMLGYSSRWAGKYPDAFAAYGQALALEPLHRGANSYLGVAYVRTDDLVKARAQLAKLESICGNKDCDEYKLLETAIATYKPQ